MADSIIEETAPIVETLNETAKNETGRTPSTPEGMALAYGSLVIMALIPIFFGSFQSVRHQAQQKASGEAIDTMTQRDAALFPLIASSALFGLYLVFSFFPMEYINLIIGSYFFLLGILALSHVFSPFISRLVPASVPFESYHFLLTKGEKRENILDYTCTTYDFVSLGICSILAVWYLVKKHWIANNMLGLAFALNGVELLHLNNIRTGALLLTGLFLYDIFWVFGTNVMVTVAKSFDAPIKLVFPQDILENGLSADNFAMLGLGDIVLPGVFIAFLLRFDKSLNRGSNTYFSVTFVAYLAGLLTTIFVMHVFKHAQPALLYLVPACLGAPIIVALFKGELKTMIQYEDNPTATPESGDGEENSKQEKKEN